MSKPIEISLKDVFNIKGTQIFNPDRFKSISSVSIDSRKIKKGSLFIAIKGEKFDGHTFIRDAIKSGANVVAIDKKHFNQFKDLEIPFILVSDTTKYLGQIAFVWRNKLKTKIIGIGGSNGKTTTKEILASILSSKWSTNKTEANNNNHIGVPLTILSTNNHHKFLVLEFGSNHPGEIKYLSEIANPEFALITNVGDSHLEFFENRNGVLKEESELFRNTLSNGRKIFLNYDDDLLRKKYSKVGAKIIYSSKYKTEFIINKIDLLEDGRIGFIINNNRKQIFISPIPGEIGAYNYFAAIVVAKTLGLTYSEIKNAERKVKAYDKRIEVKKFNSVWIINDCYNANPSSMISALSLLSSMKPDYKKIAILGDMFELGDKSPQKHKEVGNVINDLMINEIFTVGSESVEIFNSIIDRAKLKKHFTSKRKLISYLSKKNFNETVILIKGSRGMRLEEVTQFLEERLN